MKGPEMIQAQIKRIEESLVRNGAPVLDPRPRT